MSKNKFTSKSVVATQGVVNALDLLKQLEAVSRHFKGDWGDLDSHDKELNDEALQHDGRVISKFNYDDVDIYVITEWDRSVTTLLLPEEY